MGHAVLPHAAVVRTKGILLGKVGAGAMCAFRRRLKAERDGGVSLVALGGDDASRNHPRRSRSLQERMEPCLPNPASQKSHVSPNFFLSILQRLSSKR